jgi:hypothetical protein
MIYTALGREMPGNFDAEIFEHIYVMLAEFRDGTWSAEQARAYWAPIIAQVRQMRGLPPEPAGTLNNAQDDDVEMEGQAEGSVWESSSELGSVDFVEL